jgi:hypothetical protein
VKWFVTCELSWPGSLFYLAGGFSADGWNNYQRLKKPLYCETCTLFCHVIQSVQKVTNPWLAWNLCFLDASFQRDCGFHDPRTWAPQTSFYGGISRIMCIQINHTNCKSFGPTFSALCTWYQLAHCKTCSLTWFVVCITVKSVMVDIFCTYYKK